MQPLHVFCAGQARAASSLLSSRDVDSPSRSIPFTLATSLGLASIALDLPITQSEANSGLVPPAVAYFLMGKVSSLLPPTS